MSKSLIRLRKQEYFAKFDVLCDKIAEKVLFPPVPLYKEAMLSLTEMREIRTQMMLAAYYKYGPVSANYLQNNLMLPLQDAMTRVKKYERTHNVEYLLDAINYLMLTYWQYTSDIITFTEENVVEYTTIVRMSVECNSKFSEQVMALLNAYVESEDLCWVAVIAVFIANEVQFSRYDNAFYQYTQDTDCDTAGTYVNELENLYAVNSTDTFNMFTGIEG